MLGTDIAEFLFSAIAGVTLVIILYLVCKVIAMAVEHLANFVLETGWAGVIIILIFILLIGAFVYHLIKLIRLF